MDMEMQPFHTMAHRNYDGQEYNGMTVDDIIYRGSFDDWLEMRDDMRKHPFIRDLIIKVCQANISDPYAQRYHFWWNYVQEGE